MAHIVLAHGFLGVGALPVLAKGFYFNGIARLYRSLGHTVIEPSVSPAGSLAQRSAQLADAIAREWPDGREFSIIAHSMGGLDARRIIARHELGKRVQALVCIATPHFGSPVADAVLRALGQPQDSPLRGKIPDWLLNSTDALRDLMLRSVLQDNEPADHNIRYTEIACDCAGVRFRSPLFATLQAIGGLPAEGNDGVVTLSSAAVPDRAVKEVWPVDHGGAIGWPSGLWGWDALTASMSPPSAHLQRYRALLSYIE